MARDLEAVGGSFAVRAIRPGARKIPVLVTMLRAALHGSGMLPHESYGLTA
jgi:hypothetical protein